MEQRLAIIYLVPPTFRWTMSLTPR